MPRAVRERFRSLRGALAIERYLQGEDVTRIRRDLRASYPLWLRWWRGFRRTVQAGDQPAGEVARLVGQPAELVAVWQALWARWQAEPGSAERLAAVAPAGEPEAAAWPAPAAQAFYHLLLRRHHYTPAAAEQFLFDLQELAGRLNQHARAGGQVLYFGVASDEPPGRSLANSRLLPVVLEYLTPADWSRVSRDRSSDLKWERLQRLATSAHAQGVALSLPDQSQGIRRLQPGELLVRRQGQELALPLLAGPWSRRLAEGLSVAAVRRHLELEQLQALQQADPEATLEDLWRLLNPGELSLARAPKQFPVLPETPLAADRLPLVPRSQTGEPIPPEVLAPVIRALETEHGCRPAQAEGLVQLAAQLYQWCCPRSDQLQPGQLVWLAHGTRRSRRTDPRLFVPVVLTLLTPAELELPLRHRGQLKALRMAQIERLTAEAWRQDGVLTALDLEWVLHASAGLIRELLEAYQEQFGVLLPTAGTALDMGRTLTHKAIVVELSLSGLTTHEIARRIYHTPEAVDSYLRLFDRVLLLRYFDLPESVMGRITGHSPALIKEHLALAHKHFPRHEDLATYLAQRGVSAQELRSG